MGPLIPLFWTSCDNSSGFQSQWATLFAIGGGIGDVHSLKFTSSVTPTDLIHTCQQSLVGFKTGVYHADASV